MTRREAFLTKMLETCVPRSTTYADCCATDSIQVVQDKASRTILMVTHRWGGGTERHVQDLARALEADGVVVLVCREDPGDRAHITVSTSVTADQDLVTFSIERQFSAFVTFLRQRHVSHVHIHHLIGFDPSAADFFRAAAAAAVITYDVTIHDYFCICPRIHMIDGSGFYCGEPPLDVCQACVDECGSPAGAVSVWQMRDRWRNLLHSARRVFVPDADVARRLSRYFPSLDVLIRPHPSIGASNQAATHRPPSVGTNRRVALLGAIVQHKGPYLLEAAARTAARDRLPIEFIVIGYTDRDAALRSIGNVEITGPYQESNALTLIDQAQPTLAWLPSVCPETFSYTLSIAFQAGLFPVAFDLGAVAHRIRKTGFGAVWPLTAMLEPHTLAYRLLAQPITAACATTSLLPERYERPICSYYGLPDDHRD